MRRLFLLVVVSVGCGSGSGGGADGSSGNGASADAGAGADGGSRPMCRSATQACAVTADCCDPLICMNNACMSAPTCRAANGACAVTADCCDPLVCLSNKCQVAPATPVCGDSVCSGGETSASCCRDCGCPSGTTCSGTACAAVGTSTMTWNVTDSCYDGESIQLRFFDVTNGVVWPADLTQVYTLAAGETRSHPLACTTGARVCYGADQPLHALFWGVDIDGTQTCSDCCAICGTVTVSPQLFCN